MCTTTKYATNCMASTHKDISWLAHYPLLFFEFIITLVNSMSMYTAAVPCLAALLIIL